MRLSGIGVIVIGASAGGIEALVVLLAALPKNFAPALIIVQHLPRERPSSLPSIFAARCALPVIEPVDKQVIEPGTVYVAPPDYHLLVDRDPPHFGLSIDAPVNFSRPSIDVLFESAADVFGSRLLGVVLSGSNADGARGLAAVRRAGGVTIVQDPATALFAVMPNAALALGRPDSVVSVAALAEIFQTMRNEA